MIPLVEHQNRAFSEIKETRSLNEIMARYDAIQETILSAAASSYGIRAILRQKWQNGELKPIAYISRTLTNTEQRYFQIQNKTGT